MKELGLNKIAIDAIDVSDRLRVVDDAHAALLAENIRETGRLRQPIEVRRLTANTFRLIAGGHRLEAVKRLGWEMVDAFVIVATDEEARLAEIDENLVRHDLNPLDRAVFLAERKALYEKLHPETKNGAQGGRGGQRNEMDTMSFSKDTAERCGLTDRTIRRAVMIATRITSELRARIAGTWLARKQGELLALAKLPGDQQAAVVALLLAEDAPVKSVSAAAAQITGKRSAQTDSQACLTRLLTAWRHADKDARTAFVDWLEAEGLLERPHLSEAAD